MKLLEYLFDETTTNERVIDSSGQGNHGQVNPTPNRFSAEVTDENVPPGYRFKSVKFDVDVMPPSAVGPDGEATVETDGQLQFVRFPPAGPESDRRVAFERIRARINSTKSFTISMWAFHSVAEAENPWLNVATPNGKDLFCPQHVCIDKSIYTFVRTKNVGCMVDPPQRGQLAFTGPGEANVVGCGGLGDVLGGVDSGAYRVPPNQWVHLAFTLEAPSANPPTNIGVWSIYANGELKGQQQSTPALATMDIIDDKVGADIRFGNFRGNVPEGNRPAAIVPGANDYAFNGYLTGIRMYDEAQSDTDIQRDMSTDISSVSSARVTLSGDSQVKVAFKNKNPVSGFTHALVLLVERDEGRDEWRSITRPEFVDGLRLNVIDFENTSFPGGVNTSGTEDDIGGTGGQRRMRLVEMTPGDSWTDIDYRIALWQPDTTPGTLEFYAVIAVVSLSAGKPVAQLGDLEITNTVTIRV